MITSVIAEYGLAIAFILERGQKVSTPLFTITPNVAGVFKDKNDSFDWKRHRINLLMNPGEELVKASKKIKTEKVAAPKVVPIIDTFYDVRAC